MKKGSEGIGCIVSEKHPSSSFLEVLVFLFNQNHSFKWETVIAELVTQFGGRFTYQ